MSWRLKLYGDVRPDVFADRESARAEAVRLVKQDGAGYVDIVAPDGRTAMRIAANAPSSDREAGRLAREHGYTFDEALRWHLAAVHRALGRRVTKVEERIAADRFHTGYSARQNPCAEGRKDASELTDRAKRYRANQEGCRPADPKICGFCGSGEHVEVHHIDGDEDNGDASNLMWACRSCNTKLGARFKALGLGRRTVQFNPRSGGASFADWKRITRVMLGEESGDARRAIAQMKATPSRTRSRYGYMLKQNPANPPTFEQYSYAVATHERGARDESGKIIHATPKGLRQEYARMIWDLRRSRGTDRTSDVPF